MVGPPSFIEVSVVKVLRPAPLCIEPWVPLGTFSSKAFRATEIANEIDLAIVVATSHHTKSRPRTFEAVERDGYPSIQVWQPPAQDKMKAAPQLIVGGAASQDSDCW